MSSSGIEVIINEILNVIEKEYKVQDADYVGVLIQALKDFINNECSETSKTIYMGMLEDVISRCEITDEEVGVCAGEE